MVLSDGATTSFVGGAPMQMDALGKVLIGRERSSELGLPPSGYTARTRSPSNHN
jgi:hypothetical protein